MKCPVCNETEVAPTKEGTIPDCLNCEHVTIDAAWTDNSHEWDFHPDEVVWEDDDSEDYD